jgi:large repetitive protein
MAVLALGAFAPAAVQAATAKTLYVSQGGQDSGTCTSASPCATVSYALTKAASGATIEVSGTIHDHLTISHPVTITTWPGGPAGSPAVLDDAASGDYVVYTEVAGVALSDLTIENGYDGIFSQGSLTLTDSTVSGNSNGGIVNYGTMTVIDSTVTKNSSPSAEAGGVLNEGTMTVIASTIAGNKGGGIYSAEESTATLGATIVADNTGYNCGASDVASLDSIGYNLTSDKTGKACEFTAATDLVNQNPLLGPLAGNGGPTQTLLPGTTSPAADVILASTTLRGVAVCPGTDQRGAPRPGQGETRCTIGAVEAGYTSPTTTSVTLTSANVTAGTQVAYLAVVNPQSGTATPAGTISFAAGSTSLCTAVLSGGVAACGATNAPVGTDTVTGTYSGGDGYASSTGTATLTVTSAPAGTPATKPKTLYVSQGGLDSGTCTAASPCATLSYALTKAASGATIEVSGTIDDHLLISSPVTITAWPGGPAGSPAVLDGTANGIVVAVNAAGVTLDDLTIEDGTRGIDNGGTLTLTDSTVSGNAGEYGGISNGSGGTMTIIDSTVAGNSNNDDDAAGGINNYATMTIIAGTITGNTGGGIYSGQDATATLGATIVAGNTKGPNCGAHDGASLDSIGYNLTSDKTGNACEFTAATDLVNQNPLLGPLASNGGTTQTLLPGTTSPAADVIPASTTLRGLAVCPGTDQRGIARPGQGETGCTIGAVEAGYTDPTTTSVSLTPANVTAGTQVAYLAVVTPQSGAGTPAGTISFAAGSTSLCTAVLSGGVAACGATNAPVGTDTVTGAYSGDESYASSTGTATLTVTNT